MDTVEVIGKVNNFNNFSVETFIARFEALKIHAANDWEAMQEKLEQDAAIDDALAELQNGLNHLLRHKNLEERSERLRKMRDDREQLLRMEHEELLSLVAMLKSTLEMKNSINQKLQQQLHESETELENILSADIENLDEVIVEEEELERHLYACSQECDEAMLELAKLEEQNENIVDNERMLDEKIIMLKAELENLKALKRDDPEIISLHYKSFRENLQVNMNEKLNLLQNEVKRVQIELNCAENEYASLMIFLGDGEHDWSKEIEDAIATGRHFEEMITAERKASAALRNKRMEVDIECSRLEMETNVLRENNNSEITECETEISYLQKYLEKLIAEEKQEAQRYEMIRHAVLTARSAKHTHLRDKEVENHSFRSTATYNSDTSGFGEPSSSNFKRGSRHQWFTAVDDNVVKTSYDKVDNEDGMLHTVKKFEDGRAIDSEGTGKIPSDIHISRMNKADLNANKVVEADGKLANYYPLPPSAFGSPLSTNDSPDASAECEISGSELDQSIWSDFSSLVK
uniref:HAP1 N-terminal domain-containing protein n=1 Tax=Elaeophora elaphi TaxID=1147741 RepID=A0A0R3RTG6_9BILA